MTIPVPDTLQTDEAMTEIAALGMFMDQSYV